MRNSVLSPCLVIALLAVSVSCGGSGNGAGGSGGNATGSTGSGGPTGSSGAGTGSSASGQSSSGSVGPTGSGGAGGGSLASCNIPAAWASCTSPFQNGVGTCTEIDQPSGAFQSTCPVAEFHLGQSCPGAPDLFGVCIAAITGYYYSPQGAPQWITLPTNCPASGGTWCQVQ